MASYYRLRKHHGDMSQNPFVSSTSIALPHFFAIKRFSSTCSVDINDQLLEYQCTITCYPCAAFESVKAFTLDAAQVESLPVGINCEHPRAARCGLLYLTNVGQGLPQCILLRGGTVAWARPCISPHIYLPTEASGPNPSQPSCLLC